MVAEKLGIIRVSSSKNYGVVAVERYSENKPNTNILMRKRRHGYTIISKGEVIVFRRHTVAIEL